VKIICTGDWQVGAHGRRDDQEQVIERIVDLAIERRADLFLHGGDVFHGPTVYPEDLGVVRRALARLRGAGIQVVIASGNGAHDQAMRGENALAVFSEYDGVSVFGTPGIFLERGIVVGVMPWVSPARLQARYGSAANRDEVNAHVAELLVNVAQGLLEDCRRVGTDLPAVLLTHFAISGASLPTGLPVDLMSEPVLPLGELEALGFDAVVASHIHKPQILSDEHLVFFTGSPMAHDFGEAGFEHGVWILDFDLLTEEGGVNESSSGVHGQQMSPLRSPENDRSGRSFASTSPPAASGSAVEFVPIESRPLITLDFDHEDAVAQIALSASLGWDIPDGAIVRLRYTATQEEQRRIDVLAIRRQLADAGAHSVQIDAQIVRADRARVEGLDGSLSELAAFDLWTETYDFERDLAGRMRAQLERYLETVA
jgi:DNA repair protein SbcD/Mre11